MKPRVLWIEDDLKCAKLLQLELGNHFDFEIHESLSPSLRERLPGGTFDGVTIDMHLAQGRQGPEDFRRLRETGVSKLEMLALGVDDYLWKVMPTEELELRLSNTIERYHQKFRTPSESSIPA